jgi:Na+/H+-dicarboxylate symporter
VTTILAATLGLVVANVARPWQHVAAETTTQFGPETFVSIVPRNPIDAAARTDSSSAF